MDLSTAAPASERASEYISQAASKHRLFGNTTALQQYFRKRFLAMRTLRVASSRSSTGSAGVRWCVIPGKRSSSTTGPCTCQIYFSFVPGEQRQHTQGGCKYSARQCYSSLPTKRNSSCAYKGSCSFAMLQCPTFLPDAQQPHTQGGSATTQGSRTWTGSAWYGARGADDSAPLAFSVQRGLPPFTPALSVGQEPKGSGLGSSQASVTGLSIALWRPLALYKITTLKFLADYFLPMQALHLQS